MVIIRNFSAATRELDRNISNAMTSPLIITRRPTAAPAGKSAHNMSPAREAMERWPPRALWRSKSTPILNRRTGNERRRGTSRGGAGRWTDEAGWVPAAAFQGDRPSRPMASIAAQRKAVLRGSSLGMPLRPEKKPVCPVALSSLVALYTSQGRFNELVNIGTL